MAASAILIVLQGDRVRQKSLAAMRGGRLLTVLDILFVTTTAVFFAVGILYVRACERLRKERSHDYR